jgi:HK97 family phage major capsid protein
MTATYDEVLARSGLVTAGLINTKYVPGVIQEAITKSVCMSLMKREPNMSTNIESRPVMSLFPEAYWVDSEAGDGSSPEVTGGLLQTAKQGWTNATITAAKMGVVVPIPKDMIEDLEEGYDLWAEIKPRLAESIARKFDQAVLWDDTNAPTAFPDSILTDCGSASTTLVHNSSEALVDLYDEILGEGGIFSLVEGKRYNVDNIVADLSMKASMRGVRSSDGIPLWATESGQGSQRYSLAGIDVTFPENDCLPATSALMIAGNWKKAFYAWRKDISISMTDTGVVTDGSGVVLINAMQQDVVLLKATCRIGWCCPIPADIAGTANRYPFAALLPAA